MFTTHGIERFGGLELSADPADVGMGAAIDGENFELAPDGTYVRSRDGFALFGTAAMITETIRRLVPGVESPGFVEALLAISIDVSIFDATVNLQRVGSAGVTGATSFARAVDQGPSIDAVNYGIYGAFTAPVVFIATPGTLMQRYSDNVVAASVGKPKYLGVLPRSNRLVQGRYTTAADSPSGANGGPSTLFFSDPLDPETYTATNFLKLREGDGEELRGMAWWGDRLFVFKASNVFVFGGESIDATGEPIFDYREVALPSRVPDVELETDGPMVVAGARGVYFIALDGIYRTDGGAPRKISGPLDELFRRGSLTLGAIGAGGGRVFLGADDGLWVFEEHEERWLRWTTAELVGSDGFYCPVVVTEPTVDGDDAEGELIGYGNEVRITSSDVTSDRGTAIASSYQSGYSDLGHPGLKVIGQAELRGEGSVDYELIVDHGAAAGGIGATLGAAGIDSAIVRHSTRGRKMSFRVSADSDAWALHGIDLFESARLPAGVKA